MSIKSSVALTLQSLQTVIDHVEHDQCCPTTMLRGFGYRLLVNEEISIRKNITTLVIRISEG